MKASVILGLFYGDEGKGLTTDFLCSKSNNPITIRFSGGQQAGHTVIYNNIKHIHSNFGSGSLRNVPTYFTDDTTIYLNTINNEKYVLGEKGLTPKLYVHPLTMLTTPFDVAYNRASEKIKNHGSCGLGVGETMNRNINSGYKLYAIDSINKSIFKAKLNEIKKYYEDKAITNSIHEEYQNYLYKELRYFNYIIDNLELPYQIKDYDFLFNYDHLIFEGSQGILLDMNHGIFPNVTYANTTSKNIIKFCLSLGITPEIYYISRCYQTRHGNGWMSNEKDIKLTNNNEEINQTNEWQKDFRLGEFDYDLLNYSYEIDKIYSHNKNIKKHLVLTCLDQRPDFKLKFNKLPYFDSIIGSYSPKSLDFKEIKKQIQYE